MKKKKDSDIFKERTEWVVFVTSFLDIAEVACQKCEDIEVDEENHERYVPGFKISIVYNIKYAIELLLKLLIRTIDNNYSEVFGGKNGHDLEVIFKVLKDKVSKKELDRVSIIIEDEQLLALDFYNTNKDKLFDNLEILKNITIKYNRLQFLKQELIQVEDYNNTAFKYPENKFQINASINYFDFIFGKGHESIEVSRLVEDINVLKEQIISIGRTFELYNLFKK